jgi:hypothetical protein
LLLNGGIFPILKNNNMDTVFSRTFTTAGDSLPLELIAESSSNETRAYGPDFISTGAYHLEGAFLKGYNAESLVFLF